MRSALLQHTSRDLGHCAAKLKARGFEQRAVERRAATHAELMKKRNIKARDAAAVLATDHNNTALAYTLDTEESVIFASNGSCTLTPEGESGPYYVAGEYVRTDLAEDVQGVPVHYEFQILDADTCEPLVGAYFEIFNCNATGVYSGTTNTGNGNTADVTVLDETWLRGLQPTDDEGVANFDTIFPGHYTGRATHIHTLLHRNATVRENGTVFDTSLSHIGQTFWDQSTRDQVELLAPYNTNTQTNTLNSEDRVFETESENGSDPVFKYVQLGDSIEDGFLAWIVLAVNTTLSNTVSPAAVLYESGGVEVASGF
ncbi:Intradiol ring-cleavage dioxygenase [Truncatella angustata]|uniref:Intradiol ring-cleavage dioxygenase n=1 Tax=Truncatella angustata TaxID=152316 RepID=A0A9P8UUM8_9PEZI|nr:Intradiol ring-cleavage dioxygenase [Truncatella angustata]KAH6658509.1 Intradiol ring-cleavage dioxygenase [Truncatella angustata]